MAARQQGRCSSTAVKPLVVGGFRRIKRREGPDGVVWFGRPDSGPCELGPSKTVVSVAGVGAYDIAIGRQCSKGSTGMHAWLR